MFILCNLLIILLIYKGCVCWHSKKGVDVFDLSPADPIERIWTKYTNTAIDMLVKNIFIAPLESVFQKFGRCSPHSMHEERLYGLRRNASNA